MHEKFYIPAPGLRVVDPAKPSEPLPPEGRSVNATDHESYWLRRLRDGDVTEAKPALQTPASFTRGKKD
jgi:hypothetical protein